MKFLFLTPRSHPERFGWIKSLHENGHHVTVYTWKRTHLENSSVVSGIFIGEGGVIQKIAARLGFAQNRWYRKYRPLLQIGFYYRKMKECDPDVVILHNPHLFPGAFVGAICARLQGRTVVFYVQTKLYKKQFGVLKRRVIDMVTFIFNATWVTPIHGKTGGRKFNKNAHFVPLVVDPTNQLQQTKDDTVLNIITVAKLSIPRKNVLLLLQALKNLSQDIKFHLTLIGSLPEKNDSHYTRIRKYIDTPELRDRVTIKSNIPPENMREEYKRHDLFILPSTREPFGVSVLEAMGSALPVICSDTAGVSDYVTHGVNGYTFIDNNQNDLEKAIKRIASDPELRTRMAKASLRATREKYSLDTFYTLFMNTIQK